jgi:hypothetical protein
MNFHNGGYNSIVPLTQIDQIDIQDYLLLKPTIIILMIEVD